MRVFLSTFLYALAKVAAHHGGDPQKAMNLAITSGTWECGKSIVACTRALKATPGASVELWVNSTTVIGKARSMAAFAFLGSLADVWVSVDDDAEVDEATMALLLRATHHATEPRIVMIPQKLADGDKVNTAFLTIPPEPSRTVDGKRLVPVEYCGCSVMAANRAAILMMQEHHGDLLCEEQHALGLFLEEIDNHLWIGEDVAFCRRANASGLEVEILLDVPSVHAGHELSATWADPYLAAASHPTLPTGAQPLIPRPSLTLEPGQPEPLAPVPRPVEPSAEMPPVEPSTSPETPGAKADDGGTDPA